MQFIRISFIILLCIYTLILLVLCRRNGKMLKTLLLSAFSGLAMFAAVNIISRFTGVSIAVNAYTAVGSALFGIPGVLGLLTLRIIF